MKAPISDTLLLIPDISGFTRFVSENDLQHTGHVISELLEVIIDQNTLGMEIAGIEGDAIMFYREGPKPGLDQVVSMCKQMFRAFHKQLKKYQLDQNCSCGSHHNGPNLTLKFVVHYGNVMIGEIRNYLQLIGPDVHLAHRLLKNNINSKEYILMSNSFLDDDRNVNFIHDGVTLIPGSTDYYGHGTLCYSYGYLSGVHQSQPSQLPSENRLTLSVAC